MLSATDLGPKNLKQKHLATSERQNACQGMVFHHGRGFWQVLRLHRRRRAKFTLPHSHFQSPPHEVPVAAHVADPIIVLRLPPPTLLPLPLCATDAPLREAQVHRVASNASPAIPLDPLVPHVLRARYASELDELEAADFGPGTLDDELEAADFGPGTLDASELDELEAADPGPGTNLALGRALAIILAIALALYLHLGIKRTGLLDRAGPLRRHGGASSSSELDASGSGGCGDGNLAKNSWYKGSSSIAAARPESSWEFCPSKFFRIKSLTLSSL